MDVARKLRLPRAAFANKKEGRFRRGDFLDELLEPRARHRSHTGKQISLAAVLFEGLVLLAQRNHELHFLEQMLELRARERLGEIVEGAFARDLDRVVDGSKRGH